ncbi:hypothetical protein DE146DRAFT_630457 [Phaeosphaeria sp. MPI-PUGE-AT-0046c]|nr:hypothetical protein DE146DRAFT_630457 [Phaeosphaeria sp. MPI-PUGE-AT-0046c]
MKCILFLAALMGITAAKKGHKRKCLEKSSRCNHILTNLLPGADRNKVEFCINGNWQATKFCQGSIKHRHFDDGTCTEEPFPDCRKGDSPVAAVWAPVTTVTVTATPGEASTDIPPLRGAPWASEPEW